MIIEEKSTTPVGYSEKDPARFEEWAKKLSIYDVNIPEFKSANGDPDLKRQILYKAIVQFLNEFTRTFEIGIEIVSSALSYIDKMFDINDEWFEITETSAIGFLMTALALSSKFLLDRFERNTLFHIYIKNAHSSPFYKNGKHRSSSKRRMRSMQDFFLDLLDFNLYVADGDYLAILSNLKNLIAQKYAKRGQVVILDSSIRKMHHSSSHLLNCGG